VTVAPANLRVRDMSVCTESRRLYGADNKIALIQNRARGLKLRAEDELASILRKRHPTSTMRWKYANVGKLGPSVRKR
jgi:hypothetical protein